MHFLVLIFGIPLRVGFAKKGSGILLTHKVSWDDNGERWTADVHLDLARLVGAQTHDRKLRISISDDDASFAETFLQENNVGPDDMVIGIFPGGGKNSRDTVYQKRWSVKNFSRVAESLFRKYKARLIVFGSRNDEGAVSELVGLSRAPIINACGKLTLKQMAALIRQCSVFITNDSAPLHIAVAMNTPTVSLFGPSRASALVPEHEKCIAIQSTYSCSPCYCNAVFSGCDDPRCMEAIECSEVLAMAEKQIEKFCRKARAVV